MTSKGHKHRKHGKTAKANFGQFGRMEIAIMGTPCGEIKKMAQQLIEALKGFRIAYVDASHKTDDIGVPVHMQAGAEAVFTKKMKFNRLDIATPPNRYEMNRLFNEYDLVLVNGNHFEAEMQVVVVDERKPLEKKLDKITNPVAIIRQHADDKLPEYLENHIGTELEIQPLYTVRQIDKLAGLIRDMLIMNVPQLYGLVLTGGKSERMGKDKGLIDYHGAPQREYLYRMLEGLTAKTFMSCRPDQAHEFEVDIEVITDSISGLGPYGAILSAFRKYPDNAWLVMACDIPLLDEKALQELIIGRNPSKVATAFHNEETGLPDPLVTIWEPKAYPVLLHFLSLGFSCPRKALINSNAEILQPSNPQVLLNANSPEELEKVMDLLNRKRGQ